MKVYVAAAIAAGLLTAAPAFASADLAKAKNCLACHAVDKVLVGPAYKDVAAKYAGDKAAAASLAEGIVKGTGPAGKGWAAQKKASMPFMPPNAQVSPDDAKKLAEWILTLK
jgi:cytochrome c